MESLFIKEAKQAREEFWKSFMLASLPNELRTKGETLLIMYDQMVARESEEHRIRLSDAKFEFNAGLKKGTSCPCCGRFGKLYKRKITSSMAYLLILLYKYHPNEFVHVNSFIEAKRVSYALHGDFPKLRFFGLLEKKEGEREDGNPNNGFYRITPLGISFVQGMIPVKKYVYIFDNVVMAVSDETIFIDEALGTKFNYNELMQGTY